MQQFHHDVLEIVRKTRDISLPQFGIAEVKGHKGGDVTDVVTEIDQRIEAVLATELTKITPDTAFVGEEFGGDRGAERFWLADPIDGTQLFIRGLLGSTTMLALIEKGEVVMGVIYDFVTDTMYHARSGAGAYADDTAITVSDRPLDNAYIGYEIDIKKPENHERYFQLLNTCGPVKLVSSGYEYTLVASGKLDARVCFDPYGVDYDFAPGCLLVKEAGGVVTNIGSTEYDYRVRDHIAANPNVHWALTEGPNALFPVT